RGGPPGQTARAQRPAGGSPRTACKYRSRAVATGSRFPAVDGRVRARLSRRGGISDLPLSGGARLAIGAGTLVDGRSASIAAGPDQRGDRSGPTGHNKAHWNAFEQSPRTAAGAGGVGSCI